ncbi:anaphase promoting complex subunit 8 [Lipomyces oligophaga]|uniref:anaphase promoting complex subunit 8 n=1 Tax=Lipomyces oligophaga TaxID=45792 RepID=UPI0034CEA2A0
MQSTPSGSVNESSAAAVTFSTTSLAANLERAYEILTDRCLYESAKWAAEALNGLPQDEDSEEEMQDSDSSIIDDPDIETTAGMTTSERRKYKLAKSCFDCREYDRSARFLEGCTNSKALFLKFYARYMSGEKKKEEQSEVILGPLDGDGTPNKQLVPLINELEELFRSDDHSKTDPFLLYIYGIALIKHKCEKAALEPLLRSVKIYPYNWGAWLELSLCIATVNELSPVIEQVLDCRSPIMAMIFNVVTSQELFQSTDTIFDTLSKLDDIFPRFNFLKIQRAILCYHALEYAESEQLFDQVISSDPHRLDDMDMYSNILYVTEHKAKLSYLAQLASETDKFRPETCCIIANYYSLQSDHEKAVLYYRRALTLNRNCLGAWTLMGHEYVELKNIRAAIESYRRAISVNTKDVRAWYGLGQAYEVIEMYYYSFYYYQRAASIKPYDHRMWIAVGNCLEKLDRLPEAAKAYRRALSLSDMDTLILQKLVNVFTLLGDGSSVARYTQLRREAEKLEAKNAADGDQTMGPELAPTAPTPTTGSRAARRSHIGTV